MVQLHAREACQEVPQPTCNRTFSCCDAPSLQCVVLAYCDGVFIRRGRADDGPPSKGRGQCNVLAVCAPCALSCAARSFPFWAELCQAQVNGLSKLITHMCGGKGPCPAAHGLSWLKLEPFPSLSRSTLSQIRGSVR